MLSLILFTIMFLKRLLLTAFKQKYCPGFQILKIFAQSLRKFFPRSNHLTFLNFSQQKLKFMFFWFKRWLCNEVKKKTHIQQTKCLKCWIYIKTFSPSILWFIKLLNCCYRTLKFIKFSSIETYLKNPKTNWNTKRPAVMSPNQECNE